MLAHTPVDPTRHLALALIGSMVLTPTVIANGIVVAKNIASCVTIALPVVLLQVLFAVGNCVILVSTVVAVFWYCLFETFGIVGFVLPDRFPPLLCVRFVDPPRGDSWPFTSLSSVPAPTRFPTRSSCSAW